MLVQSDNTTRSGGQTMPLNMQTGIVRTSTGWVCDCVDCGRRSPRIGIWLRIRARTTLSTETLRRSAAVSVFRPNRLRPPTKSSFRQCTTSSLRLFTPYEWLSKEVVFRYRRARQEGTTSRCHRNARSRSAAPASPQQPVDGAGKSRSRIGYQTRYQGL